MRSFLPLIALPLVAADTLSNCGAATDHFALSSITTDADATGGPQKGQPFTVTVEGVWDETHQHGVLAGNLNVKALGIVNEAVPFNQKYDFFPGIAQGPGKIVIGPFTFPTSIPGEVDVTGQITIVNEKAEAVTCLNLALKIPMINTFSEFLGLKSTAAPATCGDTSSDHIQNIQSSTVDGISTTTMDLDEDLDFIKLSCDLNVKARFVPGVNLALPNVPIAITPAIPTGQLKFVGYPSSSAASNSVVTVAGDLTLQDENGDEVVCVNLSDSSVTV